MNKTSFGVVAAFSVIFFLAFPARAMPVAVPQDVIFVMDSSGSLGSSGYAQQKNFLLDVIQNRIDPVNHPIRFGLVEFSTTIREQFDFFDFGGGNDGGQNIAAMTSFINGLSLMNGTTYTRNAMQQGIDMFVRDTINPGFGSNPMTMVLITDGQPYPSSQHPCNAPSLKPYLDFNGIDIHIVGSGNQWDPNNLACLVDDPNTQISNIIDPAAIDFQQGYVQNSVAMPAPGMMTIFAFGVAGIAAVRRRAC